MKHIIVILICLIVYSCGTSKNKTNNEGTEPIGEGTIVESNNDSIVQIDTILSIVNKLDEVINFEKRYKNINGNKSVMFVGYPNNDTNYLWVKVGISNEMRFETIFNLYLNTESYSVSFFDTENDSIIALEDWRKTRGW